MAGRVHDVPRELGAYKILPMEKENNPDLVAMAQAWEEQLNHLSDCLLRHVEDQKKLITTLLDGLHVALGQRVARARGCIHVATNFSSQRESQQLLGTEWNQ